MQNKTVEILVVDDDDIDVETIKRTFKKMKIANPITTARDGVEALEVLRGENGYTALPSPYLILLDINMPRMNGLEFLTEIRNDPDLKKAIVFVLTTSDAQQDMLKAFDNNVAGYILKTSAGPSFMECIGMLDHYWRIAELPAQTN